MKRNNGSVFENRNFFKKLKNLKILFFYFTYVCDMFKYGFCTPDLYV